MKNPPLPLSDIATPFSACLADFLKALPAGSRVLDVGCLGWKLWAQRPDLQHSGCDIEQTTTTPEGVEYRLCDIDSGPLPWPDDHFDLVVAAHVIEHVDHPLHLGSEMVRVCRPGGHVYVEAPSERAAFGLPLVTAPHAFLSHWDDPTHRRPWTPRAFYRLLLCHGCRPIDWGHETSWRSRLLFPYTLAASLLARDWDRLTREWWKVIGFAAYGLAVKPPMLRGA